MDVVLTHHHKYSVFVNLIVVCHQWVLDSSVGKATGCCSNEWQIESLFTQLWREAFSCNPNGAILLSSRLTSIDAFLLRDQVKCSLHAEAKWGDEWRFFRMYLLILIYNSKTFNLAQYMRMLLKRFLLILYIFVCSYSNVLT